MRLVIDGLPVRGTSLGIVLEQLLHGWSRVAADDDLHVVLMTGTDLEVPPRVTVHECAVPGPRMLARLVSQTTTVPRLCRRLRADALLGVSPSTTLSPLPCPRAIITHDLRHELRPEQFSAKERLLRAISYNAGSRRPMRWRVCRSAPVATSSTAILACRRGSSPWFTTGPITSTPGPGATLSVTTPSPSASTATRTWAWYSTPGPGCVTAARR